MSAGGKDRSYTTKFKLEVVKYAVNNSKLAASKKIIIWNSQKVGTKQENDLLAISSSRQRLPDRPGRNMLQNLPSQHSHQQYLLFLLNSPNVFLHVHVK